jgi:GNAT superfamily N-acetyltransferase
MKLDNFAIAWCKDPARAEPLARFFADNVTTEYISHSELQGRRASAIGQWRPNIVEIFQKEIHDRVVRGRGRVGQSEASQPILMAHDGERLVGLAFVSFFPDAPTPYCIIEDIVVDARTRANGVGKKIVDWITAAARCVNCNRVFLESGHENERAHHFFEREGFKVCSVVMVRELSEKK